MSFLRNAATETIGVTGIETTGAAAATETTAIEVVEDGAVVGEVTEGCGVQRTGRRWMGMGDLTAEDASC